MTTSLSQDIRGLLLKSVLKTAASELSLWRSREAVENELSAMLEEQLGLLTDRKWAANFQRMIGVGEAEEYLNRLMRVSGVDVLCGIRFYGGDADKPFVDVIAWSGEIDDWSVMSRELLANFARFSPSAIRFFMGCDAKAELFGHQFAVPDQVLAAAPVRALAEDPNAVTLRDADPAEAHAFLVAAYERFAERRPRLADRVHASSLDELQECDREGRLAWWIVNGEVAGLIAACHTELVGMRGLIMMDEAVAAGFEGRGSAALAQRALARSVGETDPDAVLFGTIDAINHASRRAAQRAGRKEIAGWWFVQPAGSDPVSDVLDLWG